MIAQFRQGPAARLLFWGAARGQLADTIVEMLRELFDDLRFALRAEGQRAEAAANILRPTTPRLRWG